MSKEHATPAPLRVLLPAAFTLAAGIGLALAFADDAQAADRAPAVMVDQATPPAPASVEAELSPRLAKTNPAGPVLRSPAEPVREAAQRTERTVSTTGRHATHIVTRVTDAADEATVPLTVVGKTVDQVTDRASEILDTAPAGLDSPRLPRPGDPFDLLDRPAGGSAGPGQASPAAALAAAAPQTALGPAREHPPLVTAGPGADLTRLAAGTGAAAAGQPEEIGSTRLRPSRPGVPETPASSMCSLTAAASSSGDSHTLLPTSRWSTIPCWQHAITTYIADRDGHTEPPSPPPG